jgi:hypothetical protein
MGASFKFADEEVKLIARDLIRQYHTHLINARIIYLFREGDWDSQGKLVFAKAHKLGGREQFLTEANFAIVINEKVWQRLNTAQRTALIDHELCHCGINGEDKEGNPRWTIWAHDLEEFRAIVNRHGLWRPDVQQFARSIQPYVQITLEAYLQSLPTDQPQEGGTPATAPATPAIPPDVAEPGEAPTMDGEPCPMCEGVKGQQCPICGGEGVLKPTASDDTRLAGDD